MRASLLFGILGFSSLAVAAPSLRERMADAAARFAAGAHPVSKLDDSAELDAAMALPLVGGRCYVLLAVGDAAVRDIDLAIVDGARRVAEDRRSDEIARVEYCAPSTRTYRAASRVKLGDGRFALQLFEYPVRERPPTRDLPPPPHGIPPSRK